MEYAKEVRDMCPIARGPHHESSPIPVEGKFIVAKEISDLSGFSHGCGTCAPHQGACKLSLNVKEGFIEEALIETVGCSGMTHSAAMAAEIITGKTMLEALNTDLVCDAINVAMKEIFQQMAYGRSQTAFSEGGLPIGAGLEDLGKGKYSQVGTTYGTKKKGARYLNLAEGYITRLAIDEDEEIIGYEYVHTGRLMELIYEKGMDANEAHKEVLSTYGRFDEATKYINPRSE
jgi:NifU-like protein involved in Fe-S cluster formation